jgi:hypothetical protein
MSRNTMIQHWWPLEPISKISTLEGRPLPLPAKAGHKSRQLMGGDSVLFGKNRPVSAIVRKSSDNQLRFAQMAMRGACKCPCGKAHNAFLSAPWSRKGARSWPVCPGCEKPYHHITSSIFVICLLAFDSLSSQFMSNLLAGAIVRSIRTYVVEYS